MKPRNQHITPQRKDILEALDEYIYLSTTQFYRVLPKQGNATKETWERGIRRALDLFEGAGFITHGPMYEERKNKRSGFATRTFVYYLTKKGAERLVEIRTVLSDDGIDIPKVPYYQRKPASLAHEAAITEFRLNLEEAIPQFEKFLNQLPFSLQLHWIQKATRKGTNPDAVVGIENTAKPKDKSTFWFFLEIERSRNNATRDTEDGKQPGVVRKLQRYDDYRQKKEVTQDWPFIKDFRVIIQVENTTRAVNLIKKLAGILPYSFIWITGKDVIREKGFLAGIFFTPKNYTSTSYSFLDLLK